MQGSDPGELQPAPDRVDNGPAGTRFSEVRRFSEVDSTNRYLLDLARLRPLQGVVAVADHQTAGRGRQGRRWQAPRGTNLLMSVLLVPDLPADQLYLCTAAAALAAADACRELAGLQPSLKWPNDLVVGKRKLAGILAESVPLPDGGRRVVVVGLGLNVEWPPPDAGSAGFSATARRGPTTGFEGPGLSDFEPEDTSDPAAVLLTATSIRRET
ncbi:MAG TPA: biotin--[acetyl-CoA-carboxylase] ligase, partial [Acidimicrobiales bacterium]|nr:biotin--[acetyl-CoA-carboxylase] ligase [Acidimicrobiales bacterium]